VAFAGVPVSGEDEPGLWTRLPPLPDPLGVAGPFAGVSHGALIVGGGANFPDRPPWEGGKKVWHDTVWVLTDRDLGWTKAGRLPRPLGYGVCVSDSTGVVCAGGSDADRHWADCFRLVWNGGRYSIDPLPDLPVPLAAASGALVGRRLFVACGSEAPGETACSNRMFALDLAHDPPSWNELPALPGPPRLLAIAAAWNGQFLVLGGVSLRADPPGRVRRAFLRDAWAFDPSRGWRRLADLPSPCAAAASPAPIVGDAIWVVAGDDGSEGSSRAGRPPEKHPGFPATSMKYDPARDLWSAAGRTPAPRATLPCVRWKQSWVFPSGEVRPGVRSPEVWALAIPTP
jgi:N-acetylneuraminic acid mutarotase